MNDKDQKLFDKEATRRNLMAAAREMMKFQETLEQEAAVNFARKPDDQDAKRAAMIEVAKASVARSFYEKMTKAINEHFA